MNQDFNYVDHYAEPLRVFCQAHSFFLIALRLLIGPVLVECVPFVMSQRTLKTDNQLESIGFWLMNYLMMHEQNLGEQRSENGCNVGTLMSSNDIFPGVKFHLYDIKYGWAV